MLPEFLLLQQDQAIALDSYSPVIGPINAASVSPIFLLQSQLERDDQVRTQNHKHQDDEGQNGFQYQKVEPIPVEW